jgi:HK97 family phage major capsid protein
MKQYRKHQKHLFFLAMAGLALVALIFLPAAVVFLCAAPKLGAGLVGATMLPLGFRLAPDGADGGLNEKDFQSKVLGGVDSLQKALAEQVKTITANTSDITALKKAANDVTAALDAVRKQQLQQRQATIVKPGNVSDECARHLAGIAIAKGLRSGQLRGDGYEGMCKDILGAEFRTAVASSDIPLPVGYGGEVVELVSAYGAARKWGTVFPLGNGVVNLPRLKTDTAFALVAASSGGADTVPQTEWVTFTAQKFGGIVRVPSEIEEDSVVAIGQFIARYAARQIAKLEDWNFFRSTGASSTINGAVEGLAVSTITNSKVAVTGTLAGYFESTLAHWRSIRGLVDAPALGTAAYYCHPTFEQHLSSFNTSGARPYNPMAQQVGAGYSGMGATGPTLDGFPVRFVDVMPVYTTSGDAASTVFALFGDLSYQYLGVRGGIRFDTSTEAGFTTDEILIRALERFTVGLMAKGAVSGLETYSS